VLAGEELFEGGGAVEGGELLILLEGVLVVEAFEGSLVRLSAEPILLYAAWRRCGDVRWLREGYQPNDGCGNQPTDPLQRWGPMGIHRR